MGASIQTTTVRLNAFSTFHSALNNQENGPLRIMQIESQLQGPSIANVPRLLMTFLWNDMDLKAGVGRTSGQNVFRHTLKPHLLHTINLLERKCEVSSTSWKHAPDLNSTAITGVRICQHVQSAPSVPKGFAPVHIHKRLCSKAELQILDDAGMQGRKERTNVARSALPLSSSCT
jgi:hypothetical protein